MRNLSPQKLRVPQVGVRLPKGPMGVVVVKEPVHVSVHDPSLGQAGAVESSPVRGLSLCHC